MNLPKLFPNFATALPVVSAAESFRAAYRIAVHGEALRSMVEMLISHIKCYDGKLSWKDCVATLTRFSVGIEAAIFRSTDMLTL